MYEHDRSACKTTDSRSVTPDTYNPSEVMDLTDEITKLLLKYAKMHDANWVSARVNLKKGEYSVHYG